MSYPGASPNLTAFASFEDLALLASSFRATPQGNEEGTLRVSGGVSIRRGYADTICIAPGSGALRFRCRRLGAARGGVLFLLGFHRRARSDLFGLRLREVLAPPLFAAKPQSTRVRSHGTGSEPSELSNFFDREFHVALGYLISRGRSTLRGSIERVGVNAPDNRRQRQW